MSLWKTIIFVIVFIVVLAMITYKKPCVNILAQCSANKDCCSGSCVNGACAYTHNLAAPYMNSALTATNNKNLVITGHNNLTLERLLSFQSWNWDGKELQYVSDVGTVMYLSQPDPNNPVITLTTVKPANSPVLLADSKIIASSDFKWFVTLDPKTNLAIWGDGFTLPPIRFN